MNAGYASFFLNKGLEVPMRHMWTLLFFLITTNGCAIDFAASKTRLPLLFEAAEYAKKPVFAYQGELCVLVKAAGSTNGSAVGVASQKATQYLVSLPQFSDITVPAIDKYSRSATNARGRGITQITVAMVQGIPKTKAVLWVPKTRLTMTIVCMQSVVVAAE